MSDRWVFQVLLLFRCLATAGQTPNEQYRAIISKIITSNQQTFEVYLNNTGIQVER